MKKRSRGGKLWRTLELLLFFALLIAAVSGLVFGKYLTQQQDSGVIKAQQFYFTSDLLDGTNHVLNADTTTLSFELRNWADSLRFADMDIAYTVSVTSDPAADVSVSPASGTLTHGNAPTSATIVLSNLSHGCTYTVTATGTGGFVQTLRATFTVQPTSANVYKAVTNGAGYSVLTVWTENVTGTASITYPDDAIPDNTDPIMKSWLTGPATVWDSSSFAAAYSSKEYKFLTPGLSAENFTVTVGGTTAVTATP